MRGNVKWGYVCRNRKRGLVGRNRKRVMYGKERAMGDKYGRNGKVGRQGIGMGTCVRGRITRKGTGSGEARDGNRT